VVQLAKKHVRFPRQPNRPCMKLKKYLLTCLLTSLIACAHLKEEDDNTAELAAAELNKVSLYQSETTPAPESYAMPSPYLEPGENILINSSFENPVLTEPWSALLNDAVPGWHASWIDTSCTDPVRIELQDKALFSLSPDQNQYAELDGEGACTADARIALNQAFSTTPNHIYRLTFWMRARDAEHKMGLKVGIDQDYSVDFVPTADGWQIVTLNFEATQQATTVTFTDTGDGDTYGTMLDAVEVREITVDVDKLPKPKSGQRRGGKKQSFEGGRRHKDCQRRH
jgi:hypothetical protein